MRSVHLKEESKEEEREEPREDKSKADLLVENCFEDLQKYIELESKQEEISLWVSKILFCNKAYDEAMRSLNKITVESEEVRVMREAIAIYEGEFAEGGPAGAVLQTAFEGNYLSPEEEASLLSSPARRSGRPGLLAGYERWLVVLHLYVREQYSLLLKFLQRELFECEEGPTQGLLRYNVAVLYLLMQEHSKALNALRSLAKGSRLGLEATLQKLERLRFEEDECLPDAREELGITCSKLLSAYLPYRSVRVGGQNGVRLYVRPSIPFPEFPRPSL
jgi:hypothetical protein